MSLLEENKAERRTRICAAARKLVGERGYDGLTMRDLAHAARVSVPTLYNLFGSKDAILCAELAAFASSMAARLPTGPDVTFFQRGKASFELALQQVEESPEFLRAVVRMFMTSPESAPMRQRAEDAIIALIGANLVDAKRAGQLADWAEPLIVARHIFAQYSAVFLSYGAGEIDLRTFRVAALSGICHLLAGVARGPFAVEVERELRVLAKDPVVRSFTEEVRHAKRR